MLHKYYIFNIAQTKISDKCLFLEYFTKFALFIFNLLIINLQNMYRYLLIFCCIFLYTLLANAQKAIILQQEQEIIDISKQFSVLKNNPILQEVLGKDAQPKYAIINQDSLALPTKDSMITWIKFSLQNHTEKDIYLEVGNFSIPYFEVYIPNISGSHTVKKLGNILPASAKEVRSNLFLVHLASGQDTLTKDFYLAFYHQYIQLAPIDISTIPLRVGSLPLFMKEIHSRDLFFGSFIGIIIIMSVYNFFIYLSIKEKSYIYYILHILLTGLATITFAGYGFDILWAEFPWLNEYIYAFVVNLPNCFLIGFSIYFLETYKYAPVWHKILLLFVFLFIANTLWALTGNYASIVLGQLLILILCLFLFIISLRIYLKGHKTARFYIMANTAFIAGVVLIILVSNRLIPNNFFTAHANQIGTILEILLFSLALTDKIKTLTNEREEAQKENLRLIEEQKEILEQKVRERTKELETANQEIIAQNEELMQQQEEILAVNEALEQSNMIIKHTSDRLNKSIQYANRIQQVILPKKEKINHFFKEHFALYFPKDVVSGDFYWFTLLNEQKAIFVLADCTGHGVPGAFMSIIGSTLLHEITKTKHIHLPSEIIYNLDIAIRNILKQEQSRNSDGMDIAVCLFEKEANTKTYQILFAGAKSDLFYIKENQIYKLNGDRISVGGLSNKVKTFKNEKITLQEGDLIYFSSDGYIDQNNVERKRFGSHQFKELLLSIATLPMQEQEIRLLEVLKAYQQDEEQRDDISVIGIKL